MQSSVVEHGFAEDALVASEMILINGVIFHNIVNIRDDILLNLSGVEFVLLLNALFGVMKGLLGILGVLVSSWHR